LFYFNEGVSMLNFEKLNSLSSKIKEITKDTPLSDANQNVNALFRSALTKMELVSRDEFDIQTEVLLKTQTKLAALEAKLLALELLLAKKP